MPPSGGNQKDAQILDFLGKRLGCRDIRKAVSGWMSSAVIEGAPARSAGAKTKRQAKQATAVATN